MDMYLAMDSEQWEGETVEGIAKTAGEAYAMAVLGPALPRVYRMTVGQCGSGVDVTKDARAEWLMTKEVK